MRIISKILRTILEFEFLILFRDDLYKLYVTLRFLNYNIALQTSGYG